MSSSITISKTNDAARRFATSVLRVAIVAILSIAAFNFLVDPYNRYGNNRLGVYISAARENKSTQVRRFPHNALLMGNSRTAMLPADRLQGFRFFNGAFSGGTAEEAYYFLQHFASNEEVVVLQVDLGQRDPTELAGDKFGTPTFNDILDNLLSLKSVEYSFRTIFDHLGRKRASYAIDGSEDTETWIRLYDHEDATYQKWQMENWKNEIMTSIPTNQVSLVFYSKIATLLRERGIPCVVCIPPLHQEVAAEIRSAPQAVAAYAAWRAKIDSIFPHVVDLSFSSYGADENYYKIDSRHFKPEAGVRLLNAEVVPIAMRVVRDEKARHFIQPSKTATNQVAARTDQMPLSIRPEKE